MDILHRDVTRFVTFIITNFTLGYFLTRTVLHTKAGKIQTLTMEEREHILPMMRNAQWVEVVGRDAIYKEFLFKDFNQVINYVKLPRETKAIKLFRLTFFTTHIAYPMSCSFPFRLLGSCPE